MAYKILFKTLRTKIDCYNHSCSCAYPITGLSSGACFTATSCLARHTLNLAKCSGFEASIAGLLVAYCHIWVPAIWALKNADNLIVGWRKSLDKAEGQTVTWTILKTAKQKPGTASCIEISYFLSVSFSFSSFLFEFHFAGTNEKESKMSVRTRSKNLTQLQNRWGRSET